MSSSSISVPHTDGISMHVMEAELHVKYTAIASTTSTILPETAQSSADLHSVLVDSAISRISFSLPTEVSKVTELQRHQSSQISALQNELQQLEEQKRKVLQKSGEMKEEMEHVQRHTYLLEEDCLQKTKRCTQFRNEVLNLIKDNEAKRRAISLKRLEFYTLQSKLRGYTNKLEDFTSSITTTDATDSGQADVKAVEERLAKLKERRELMKQNPEETDRVCCGAVEKDLQDDIAQLTAESDAMSERLKQLQHKVDSIKAKQEQVKQTTAVLHKRNAAQVIRLKRQVKEQHLRHRQWTEQARLLQQNVSTLNQKFTSV